MSRVILHLDMDAFYASIEQRDQPRLKGKPVIVGGSAQERGVVCAASYEARKFGVRSAMPSSTARRLCPNGIFVPPAMEKYRAESRVIMGFLKEISPIIEPLSIDEAYLDLTDVIDGSDFAAPIVADPISAADAKLLASIPAARQLKERIAKECDLSASIGIASNKFLAKVGSDFQKPNGLTVIPERDKAGFLRPLPVRTIYGVGKVTEQALITAGIRTIGDLQDYPSDLRPLVGSFAAALRQFAFGEDDRPVDVSDEVKSISSEETFTRDTADRGVLRAFLRAAAREIEESLRERRLAAFTVQVRVRYGDFTTLTRQITVEDPICQAAQIYRLGCFLLARHNLVNRPLRLLGLGVSKLGDAAAQQLALFS